MKSITRAGVVRGQDGFYMCASYKHNGEDDSFGFPVCIDESHEMHGPYATAQEAADKAALLMSEASR